MNTVANDEACLSIKAKHIGPIMELEGKLSPKGQNLLFATSGTGKSFISRALRALDGPIEEGETLAGALRRLPEPDIRQLATAVMKEGASVSGRS